MAIALSGSLVITGSIFATQGITGSFSGNATSASYADTLQGLGSASFAPAATFNTVSQSFAATSGSLSTRVTNLESTSSTVSSSFAITSGSLSTRVTNLESTSSTVSSSFATTSGSIAGRVTLIEGQYATTGSNNFTRPQQISDVSNAISFTSTASLYTDGGLRVKGSSFVSGTAYFNNVVVYGTSSIQYLTSSQVAIGTNIITLNTDTPSIRFGGISVYDSGSNNQSTGSLFWDSEKDRWVYSNPSGSTYDGGMLISGPRNTSGLGNELGTTSCALMMGQGGDHITSSAIFSYSNATCFYGQSYINSSGLACFNDTVCANTFKSRNLIVCEGVSNSLIASSNNEVLRIQGFCQAGMFMSYMSGSTVLGDVGNGNQVFSSGDPAGFGINARGSRVLQLGTNQAFRMSIASTGETTFACQVCTPGIFSSADSRICGNLQISAGSSTSITLYNAGSIRACISMTGNEGDLSLYSSAAAKNVYLSAYYDSYINGPGKFGIGTSLPCSLLHIGTYASAGKYVDSATLPTAPSNYLITLSPPSTTNYYGGGIAWSEGTCVAAGINVYDDGALGALGLSISTGTNSGLSERLRITSTGIACFACQICTTIAALSGNVIFNRANTSAGNSIEWRTASTLNWYIGTRGLVNNSFYFVNEGLGANNLILDATSGVATFACTVCMSRLYVENNLSQASIFRQTDASGYSSLRLYNDQGSGTRALEIDYMGSSYSGGERAEIFVTGAYPLLFGTSNTCRISISNTGITSFACQVCAPQYITTQGSSVSYAAGTNYIVWNSESEYCVQDNNTGGTYSTMKCWVADRTGCLTLRFTGYIQSGPNYWAWRVTKNGTSSFVCASYVSCLAPGCSTSVHTYTTFQSDIGPVNPGDCIALQMVSSTGGGTPVSGAGQYLFAKELRLHSTTPNFSAGSPSNVFGDWVGIGTCTPYSNLYINGNNDAAYDATVDNGQDGCGVTLTVRNNSTVTNSFSQLNLQVSGDSGRAVGRIALIRTASATGDMAFITENGNTKAEKMRITSAGVACFYGQVQTICGINSVFNNGSGARYNFTSLNTAQDLVGICANNGILVIRDHTAGGTGAFLIDPNQGVICMASNIPATVSIAWSGSVWRWCLTTGGVPRCLGYGFYGA